jgi:peptide/nickel transport system substrate-binding protein
LPSAYEVRRHPRGAAICARDWPRFWLAWLVWLGAFAALTVSCSPERTAARATSTPLIVTSAATEAAPLLTLTLTPPPPPATLTPSAERLAQVIEAGPEAPAVFNPLLPAGASAQRVIDNLYDTLLTIDAQSAALEPRLASTWQVSTDNMTVTFHLRTDVTWHDGQPLTARDVVFTFDAIRKLDAAPALKAQLAFASRVLAPDDRTVVIGFDRSACPLLAEVGQIPILPRHLLEGRELTNANFNTRAPVGTGPFRFERQDASGDVHLSRNDQYFLGVPHFSEWVYRPITDTAALSAALHDGALDLATVSSEQAVALDTAGASRLLAYPQPEYYAIILNMGQPSLEDVRVREALSAAIDRQGLLGEVFAGRATLLNGPLLPGHWAYTAATAPESYDPARARRLLAEAGWTDSNHDGLLEKNGTPLRIGLSVNGENALRQSIAARVQRNWLAVGVAAEVQAVEFSTLVERLFGHHFDASVFSWPVHADPDQTRFWASSQNVLWSGFNVASYSSIDKVDPALHEGLWAAACDPKIRAPAYAQMQAALAADLPYIFLLAPNAYVAASARLAGLQPGPYAGLSWNIEQWQLTRP